MFEQVTPAIQDFVSTLLTGVLAVVSAFLIALVKKGFDWINVKIEKLADERAKDALEIAKANLENIVVATVTSLQQTLGDTIKESIKNGDGKYSYEDLSALKNKALILIKEQLTDASKEILTTAYSDLDSFIDYLIETKVYELKLSIRS